MVITRRIFMHLFLAILLISLVSGLIVKIGISEDASDRPMGQYSKTMVSGEINPQLFSRSIPGKMVVGQTYTVIMLITNTGTVVTEFLVYLDFPLRTSSKYFYSSYPGWKKLTLNPGEFQKLNFDIAPLNVHVGPMEIVGYLYSTMHNQTELMDSVSATVYEIQTAFPVESVMWAIGTMLFLGMVALAYIFLRRPAFRVDIIIAFMLFFVAFSLRALNLMNVATVGDEMVIAYQSYDVINNHWIFSREMMWYGYPPLTFYLNALLFFLFGSSLKISRWVSVIAGSLTIPMLYFLAKSIFSRKVGLLSALLLTFSSFHILYSRLAMMESLVLFFVTASSFFLWMGYKKKRLTYMCISGILLGLGLNTKYIVLTTLIASISFVVWIERSWKPLLKKQFLAWLATVVVIVLPYQFSLLLNRVNPYSWYLSQIFGSKPLPETASGFNMMFLELIPRGLRTHVYVLSRTASPWLPWLPAYQSAIVVLFLITVLYHIYPLLKARTKESFLMLFFFSTFLLVIINPVRHNYWLLYLMPYYFIMLANTIVVCSTSLRASNSGVRDSTKRLRKLSRVAPLKISVLLFAGIFVFSNLVVGTMAPIIDKGEWDGARSAWLYIKGKARQGDIVAGWWAFDAIYYINQYNINVTLIPLERITPQAEASFLGGRPIFLTDFVLNEYSLRIARYVIISRAYFNFYFNETMKEEVLKNFNVIWFGKPPVGYYWDDMVFQNWLIFERKTE